MGISALLLCLLAGAAAGGTGAGAFCQGVLELGQTTPSALDQRTAPPSGPSLQRGFGTDTQGGIGDLLPPRGQMGSATANHAGGGWIDLDPIHKDRDVNIVPLPSAALAGMGLLIGCLGIRALRGSKR